MIEVNKNTKAGKAIIDTFYSDSKWSNKGNIWTAYEKPSNAKVRAYEEIEERARGTAGYNNDLRVQVLISFLPCIVTPMKTESI